MKIDKKLNESRIVEVDENQFFETEEEAAKAEADKKEVSSVDDVEPEVINVKEIGDETEEHLENTTWAEQWRDMIEDIGMAEYTGSNSGSLMKTLDHFLYQNLRQKADALAVDDEDTENNVNEHTTNQPGNILILGQPGTGKSAIIEEWIKSRHLRGLKFTGGELRQSVIQGLPFKTTIVDKKTGKEVERQGMLGSTAFDLLDTENEVPSILFIDEINRSMREAESAILTLVQSHTIPDKDAEGGERKFNDFLFTIAAANPSAGEDERTVRKLSLALKTRFTTYFQESSIQETAEYLNKKLDRLERGNQRNIKQGKKSQKLGDLETKASQDKKAILEALLDANGGRGIQYDDANVGKAAAEKEVGVLNARTLEMALMNCNGLVGDELNETAHGRTFTPNSFLDLFAKTCGEARIDEVMAILEPVAEAQDNANNFQKTWMDKYNVWKKRYNKR